MFFAPGLPILNVTMLFFLMLNLLPLVPASPCSTHSPNNVFTHKDSLSTPGPSIEVMSRLGPGVPLPPLWASASEATIVPLQPAADATSGHIPSIPTQDPSPFYHNSRSSWRSEDIANVLLGGITTLAALLALGTKYILIPLCTRGRQSGQESTDLEASEPSSDSHDNAMPLENIQPQSRAESASSDDTNGASAT